MSFGFSPSDIVTLVNLAHKTYRGWKTACGDYADITCSLDGLVILLERIEDEAEQPHTALVRSKRDLEDINNIISTCNSTVQDLSAIITKYRSLGLGKSRERNWDRIRFGNKNLEGLKTKLLQHQSALSAYLNTIGLSSLTRIERDLHALPDKIQRTVDGLAADIRAGKREGSIMTTYYDDEKEVWKQFRRELIGEGLKSSFVHKYKPQIRRYLRALAEEGSLDEDALPSENESVPASRSSLACSSVSDEEALARPKTILHTPSSSEQLASNVTDPQKEAVGAVRQNSNPDCESLAASLDGQISNGISREDQKTEGADQETETVPLPPANRQEEKDSREASLSPAELPKLNATRPTQTIADDRQISEHIGASLAVPSDAAKPIPSLVSTQRIRSLQELPDRSAQDSDDKPQGSITAATILAKEKPTDNEIAQTSKDVIAGEDITLSNLKTPYQATCETDDSSVDGQEDVCPDDLVLVERNNNTFVNESLSPRSETICPSSYARSIPRRRTTRPESHEIKGELFGSIGSGDRFVALNADNLQAIPWKAGYPDHGGGLEATPALASSPPEAFLERLGRIKEDLSYAWPPEDHGPRQSRSRKTRATRKVDPQILDANATKDSSVPTEDVRKADIMFHRTSPQTGMWPSQTSPGTPIEDQPYDSSDAGKDMPVRSRRRRRPPVANATVASSSEAEDNNTAAMAHRHSGALETRRRNEKVVLETAKKKQDALFELVAQYKHGLREKPWGETSDLDEKARHKVARAVIKPGPMSKSPKPIRGETERLRSLNNDSCSSDNTDQWSVTGDYGANLEEPKSKSSNGDHHGEFTPSTAGLKTPQDSASVTELPKDMFSADILTRFGFTFHEFHDHFDLYVPVTEDAIDSLLDLHALGPDGSYTWTDLNTLTDRDNQVLECINDMKNSADTYWASDEKTGVVMTMVPQSKVTSAAIAQSGHILDRRLGGYYVIQSRLSNRQINDICALSQTLRFPTNGSIPRRSRSPTRAASALPNSSDPRVKPFIITTERACTTITDQGFEDGLICWTTTWFPKTSYNWWTMLALGQPIEKRKFHYIIRGVSAEADAKRLEAAIKTNDQITSALAACGGFYLPILHHLRMAWSDDSLKDNGSLYLWLCGTKGYSTDVWQICGSTAPDLYSVLRKR